MTNQAIKKSIEGLMALSTPIENYKEAVKECFDGRSIEINFINQDGQATIDVEGVTFGLYFDLDEDRENVWTTGVVVLDAKYNIIHREGDI